MYWKVDDRGNRADLIMLAVLPGDLVDRGLGLGDLTSLFLLVAGLGGVKGGRLKS